MIIGKIVSSFPRVMYCPNILHYRHLDHDKTVALKIVSSFSRVMQPVSSFPRVMYCPNILHYRHLEHDMTVALKNNNSNFEAAMAFFPATRKEL